ncbi:MAG: hypothetical protein QOC61_1780, partial [Acidobacteriota bacterium]|nr:hypothetical protein [Acidobacteriota bacterium]
MSSTDVEVRERDAESGQHGGVS